MIRKASVVVLMLICLGISAHGQQAPLDKANALFNAGAYSEAIKTYRNGDFVLLLPKESRGEVFFKTAEAYRLIGQYRQAEIYYEKAQEKGYKAPEFFLNYAKVLLINESYEKALSNFEEYKKLKPNSPAVSIGIQSVELAQKLKKNPTSYVVDPLPFINGKTNDFSPAIIPNDPKKLFFSSSRVASTGISTHSATGEEFSDIFVCELDNRDKWVDPKPVAGINSDVEEATCTFNQDGSEIYFSRARIAKRKQMGCEIYVAKMEGTRYGNPILIPIAADSVIVTHPSLSADGKTLYFASNLSGGMGGLDIWKVTRDSDKGEWGKPQNLGAEINTAGNEAFPYIHPDGTLYFASNGRPGMGGYDIFISKQQGSSYVVENMGYPINSSSDDFGITFLPGKETGYFTSRRPGGKGEDDVYMFHLPPIAINIAGAIVDSKNKKPLEGSIVKMLGNDGSTVNTQTGGDGTFKFMMKPNTDYIVIATKKGYLNGKYKVNTFDVKGSKEYLPTIEVTSYEKPIEVPNIFYDFDKWNLKPESTAALDLLIETLNDNPSIIIEMGSHTDSRGGLEYNYKLSQNRAQAAVDYLIEKGIPTERLRAKGYASSAPKVVDEQLAKQYPFLAVGMVLNDQNIAKLDSDEKKDVAHQLNRRTEFKVISTTYIAKE
ncbi:OmpA family protein [uncultured Acetobacteroides sp.]|uniref:PorE family type IX secretion system protein n=1 Tax=uncultured Acetobacteroides sp. TaxID=1760811 RepID=UPI0029F5C841|nr:OmpA family protein [uncultured Acetobacteroides sp.]